MHSVFHLRGYNIAFLFMQNAEERNESKYVIAIRWLPFGILVMTKYNGQPEGQYSQLFLEEFDDESRYTTQPRS